MLLEAPSGAGLGGEERGGEAVCLPEGLAVSDALCNALRDLADENNHITAEGLCGSAGLDEGILGALEQRIGPGPWPVAKLEALLGTIFGAASGGEDHLGDEGISAKLADEVTLSAPWCTAGKAPSCHWRTPELQQLEDAIDDALHAEDTGAGQVFDEPESEHPLEVEAPEAGIFRVQEAISARIIDPIVHGSSGTEEAVARQMLPTFADDILAVLRKTWRLAHIRGQQVQQLQGSLASARAKVKQQQIELEGCGSHDKELLESTVSRLNAAKCAVKEKDWALADARRKIEQLEHDRTSQERRLRVLETASQRETQARGEAERRLAQAESAKEAEVSQAAEQEDEMKRRLSSAEAALGEAREELSQAEQRCEEVRLAGDRRSLELGAELSESRRLLDELRRQLEDARSSQTPAGGDAGRRRRRSEGDSGSRGAGRERQQRLSLPARSSLEVVPEEGDEAEEAQHQQRHRRSQKQLASGDAGGAPPVPSLRGLLPPPAGADQAPRTLGSLGRPKSLNSLPMDLKGLGKLLTGGGVTPRR